MVPRERPTNVGTALMVPMFFWPSRVATAEVVGGVMLGVVVYFTTMTALGGPHVKRIVAVLTGNR